MKCMCILLATPLLDNTEANELSHNTPIECCFKKQISIVLRYLESQDKEFIADVVSPNY